MSAPWNVLERDRGDGCTALWFFFKCHRMAHFNIVRLRSVNCTSIFLCVIFTPWGLHKILEKKNSALSPVSTGKDWRRTPLPPSHGRTPTPSLKGQITELLCLVLPLSDGKHVPGVSSLLQSSWKRLGTR